MSYVYYFIWSFLDYAIVYCIALFIWVGFKKILNLTLDESNKIETKTNHQIFGVVIIVLYNAIKRLV